MNHIQWSEFSSIFSLTSSTWSGSKKLSPSKLTFCCLAISIQMYTLFKKSKKELILTKWRNTIYHKSHQIHFRSSEQRTRTRPLELYRKKQGAPSVNLYAFWPTTQWQHNRLSATFEIIYRASFQSQLKVDHPPACETPVQMFLTAATHWFISVHEWWCDSSRQCFTSTAHLLAWA